MDSVILEFIGKIIWSSLCIIGGWGFSAVYGSYHERRMLYDGMCSLLRDAIINKINKARDEDRLLFSEKENILKMYKSYRGLGGNDIVESLIPSLDKIRTIYDLDHIPDEGEK